jgi:lauroyl/myristoyl acyltransferase
MALAGVKLRVARRLDRCLPPAVLATLVWPGIVAVACWRALGRHGHRWREALRGMRAGRPGFLSAWRHVIDDTYLMAVTFWPDRWHEPRWARRFHLTGLRDVQKAVAEGVPVVVAVVHFTHMSMLRYLLRSSGISAATLAGYRGEHPTVAVRDALLDRITGLDGVPNRFVAADLRSAYAFLRSGKCLIIACDVMTSEGVAITTELGTLQMAVGPLRLARMTGALVVPAILWQPRRWWFEARFGEPFRLEGDGDSPEAFRPAAERCMRHWLPVMQAFPTQYDGGLANAWSSQTVSGVSDISAAADT